MLLYFSLMFVLIRGLPDNYITPPPASEYGVPYGTAPNAYPNYLERAIMSWINLIRVGRKSVLDKYMIPLVSDNSKSNIFTSSNLPSQTPLYWDLNLNRAGRFHVDDKMTCLNSSVYMHNSCDNTSMGDRVWSYFSGGNIGEIHYTVAGGKNNMHLPFRMMGGWICDGSAFQRPTAVEFVNCAVDESAGHRKAIMNSNYNQIGCGAAKNPTTDGYICTCDLGGDTTTYATSIKLVSGSHVVNPLNMQQYMFILNFVGTLPETPTLIVNDGTPQTMALEVSLNSGGGAYSTSSVNYTASDGCQGYFFKSGDERYPKSGYFNTYGLGTCTVDWSATLPGGSAPVQCTSRTAAPSGDWPCGNDTGACFQDIGGTNTSKCVTICTAAHHEPDMKTGKCALKTCTSRTNASAINWPCGNSTESPQCFQDIGGADIRRCVTKCTREKYESDNITGKCISLACTNQTANAGRTYPCEVSTDPAATPSCFQNIGGPNETACVTSCTAAHHEGSAETGKCVLKTCASRTNASGGRWPCGDVAETPRCYQDIGGSAGDTACAAECSGGAGYVGSNTTGLCTFYLDGEDGDEAEKNCEAELDHQTCVGSGCTWDAAAGCVPPPSSKKAKKSIAFVFVIIGVVGVAATAAVVLVILLIAARRSRSSGSGDNGSTGSSSWNSNNREDDKEGSGELPSCHTVLYENNSYSNGRNRGREGEGYGNGYEYGYGQDSFSPPLSAHPSAYGQPTGGAMPQHPPVPTHPSSSAQHPLLGSGGSNNLSSTSPSASPTPPHSSSFSSSSATSPSPSPLSFTPPPALPHPISSAHPALTFVPTSTSHSGRSSPSSSSSFTQQQQQQRGLQRPPPQAQQQALVMPSTAAAAEGRGKKVTVGAGGGGGGGGGGKVVSTHTPAPTGGGGGGGLSKVAQMRARLEAKTETPP